MGRHGYVLGQAWQRAYIGAHWYTYVGGIRLECTTVEGGGGGGREGDKVVGMHLHVYIHIAMCVCVCVCVCVCGRDMQILYL